MIASTGCTSAQAWAEWDIPALLRQSRYWAKHPPVHILVAAYLGFKGEDDEEDREFTADELFDLFPMN